MIYVIILKGCAIFLVDIAIKIQDTQGLPDKAVVLAFIHNYIALRGNYFFGIQPDNRFMKDRNWNHSIASDLKELLKQKMVLLSGPRQVGKMFLAKTLFLQFSYYNYDIWFIEVKLSVDQVS